MVDNIRREQTGKLSLISVTQEQITSGYIPDGYTKNERLTWKLLQNKVFQIFDVSPSIAWPYNFPKLLSNQITICLAVPQTKYIMNMTKVIM
jgi:hypothetical protein